MLHFSNISIKDVLRNTADDVTTLLDKKPKVSQEVTVCTPLAVGETDSTGSLLLLNASLPLHHDAKGSACVKRSYYIHQLPRRHFMVIKHRH